LRKRFCFWFFSALKVISFSEKTKEKFQAASLKGKGQRAESKEPGAGSQKQRVSGTTNNDNNDNHNNKQEPFEPLRTYPPFGRVKNPSIGLRQTIEKTPRLFLTRFFADFFIE